MKMILYAVKQPSQYSKGFQPFPGVEAKEKILAHYSSGSRNRCSRSCTGELISTVDNSNCVTSVHCLHSSLFVLQSWKSWKVPQSMVTSETEMFQLLVQVPPSCGYLDQQGFSKHRKYRAI